MKRLILFILLSLLTLLSLLRAKDNEGEINKSDNQLVSIGAKAGFNSSMFLVSRFKIKDVTINDFQNNYEIGYFAAIFLRFNINRHFIQTEASYNISKCEITFDKLGSQHPDLEPDYAAINSKIHSVDFPILYGYNIVKQKPYGMSLFMGPKLRCILGNRNEITFENFDQKGVHEELYPFNISLVVGLGVNISRIFFDFRYEQGLHNISRSVSYDNINADGSIGVSSMMLHRREQVLSFSLGVLF